MFDVFQPFKQPPSLSNWSNPSYFQVVLRWTAAFAPAIPPSTPWGKWPATRAAWSTASGSRARNRRRCWLLRWAALLLACDTMGVPKLRLKNGAEMRGGGPTLKDSNCKRHVYPEIKQVVHFGVVKFKPDACWGSKEGLFISSDLYDLLINLVSFHCYFVFAVPKAIASPTYCGRKTSPFKMLSCAFFFPTKTIQELFPPQDRRCNPKNPTMGRLF